MSRQAYKFGHPALGVSREAIDAIDMEPAFDELVDAIVDPPVLGVANVDRSFVAPPTIAINDGIEPDLAGNHMLHNGLHHIRDDLGVGSVAALKHTEHYRCAYGNAVTLAVAPAWGEVRLVVFHFSRAPEQDDWGFTLFGAASPKFKVDRVYWPQRQAGKVRSSGNGRAYRGGLISRRGTESVI